MEALCYWYVKGFSLVMILNTNDIFKYVMFYLQLLTSQYEFKKKKRRKENLNLFINSRGHGFYISNYHTYLINLIIGMLNCVDNFVMSAVHTCRLDNCPNLSLLY